MLALIIGVCKELTVLVMKHCKDKNHYRFAFKEQNINLIADLLSVTRNH